MDSRLLAYAGLRIGFDGLYRAEFEMFLPLYPFLGLMSNTVASDREYDAPTTARSEQPLVGSGQARSAPCAGDLMKTPLRKPLWKEIMGYVLSQWLIIGLGIFIILAWAFPSVGRNGGAIRAEITVKWVGVGG